MKLYRLSSPVTVTWCSQKTILLLSGLAVLYARAAARALLENTELSAREIAEKALDTAGDIWHSYQPLFHTIEELSYKAGDLPCSEMTPREIVSELDKHIIGQTTPSVPWRLLCNRLASHAAQRRAAVK